MGSRKAVLSAPRTLDMVPLGEILQGRSNQGVKAYSDNSDRYNSDIYGIAQSCSLGAEDARQHIGCRLLASRQLRLQLVDLLQAQLQLNA